MKRALTLLFVLTLHAFADLAGRKPNLLLIMTDDQGRGQMASHGHPPLTPRLRST